MLSLDHIVIVVHDLEKASADYAALGFTVVPGGEHADGSTHNALVAFADGSYLELIAFLGVPPQTHAFYRTHGREGPVTFALLPGDINRVVPEARERGLELTGPSPGGRLRPDGVEIAWQTAWPKTHDLPFLCADVTPKDLRVPFGEAHRHANGVIGVTDITVLVEDQYASAERYRALLGTGPVGRDLATFQVGGTTLTLKEAKGGLEWLRLTQHDEGPYSLTLRSTDAARAGTLDPALTHGAGISIVVEQLRE